MVSLTKFSTCLNVALAVGLGFAGAGHTDLPIPPVEKPDQIIYEYILPAHHDVREVSFLKLSGAKVANLNSWYVGVNGKIPDHGKVDFDQNLRALWHKKLTTTSASPATQKAVDRVIASYVENDAQTMSLSQFIDGANTQARDSWSHIDFVNLCKHYHLDGSKCILLRDITGNIHGADLVAYGMTEIFPTKDGDFNKKMLSLLLENAGANYINHIPALGDGMLSMGFYQFTSHAVRHDDMIEGANVIDMYAGKGYHIAGSVMNLTSEEQHRAAFYFATYNIMRMINCLNPAEEKVLKAHMPMKEENMVAFIAASHHLPSATIDHTKAWLDGKASKPLADYFGKALSNYVDKTKANLAAIKRKKNEA